MQRSVVGRKLETELLTLEENLSGPSVVLKEPPLTSGLAAAAV